MSSLEWLLSSRFYAPGQKKSTPDWDSWFIDIEEVNRQILKLLIEQTNTFLGDIIPSASERRHCIFDAHYALFDLVVQSGSDQWLIELKTFTKIRPEQAVRQRQRLDEKGCHGLYVLLGGSAAWHPPDAFEALMGPRAQRVSYQALLPSLDRTVEQPGLLEPVKDLAASYRVALANQRQRLVANPKRKLEWETLTIA